MGALSSACCCRVHADCQTASHPLLALAPYTQTGLGLLLPLEPPYNKLTFLAAGGVSKDRADPGTPASAEAHTIEVRPASICHERSCCPALRSRPACVRMGFRLPAAIEQMSMCKSARACPRACS